MSGPRQASGAAAPGKTGGTVTVAVMGDFASFDPFNMSWVNYPMTQVMYNQFMRYDHEMKLFPELAESWKTSQDGKTLTLKLRQGVKFHNGREMTAEDVLKNFDKARNKAEGIHMYPSTLTVESVKAVDKYTVDVNFSRITPEMLDVMEVMSTIAPESMANLKNRPVGTGAFKFVEWIPGDHATLERFPDYWDKPKPYVDKVVYKIFSDVDAMVAALQAGTVDVVISLPPKDYDRLKGSFNIVRGQTAANHYTLYLNPQKEPFVKKEVRQAIQWALDRQGIVDKILFGQSEPTVLLYPKFSLAYNPKFDGFYKFDPAKAKELLGKAGYGSGFKATIVAPTNFPELVDMSQFLQADLKKIGVELDVQPLDPAQWYPKLNSGDYQMTFSFAGNSHKYPTRMALGTAYRLANNPLWPAGPPKAYADAVNAANGTLNPAEQKRAFDRIQEVMLDEAWNLSVAWRYTLFASQKYVRGLDWSVDDMLALDSIWLDK
jgi:ABC-type transport system substrate-binding protein